MKRQVVMLAASAMLLASGLVVSGCKKQDTQKPTIEVITPNEKDHDVMLGGKLKVKALLKDDQELSSAKLNVHSAADGHGHEGHHHGHGSLKTRAHEHKEFAFDKSFDINGKTYTLEYEIEIPGDALEGPYHLGVFCTDKAGNEEKVFVDIHIENLM